MRRKEERSKVKQTTRQSNTAHPKQSLFLRKNELPRMHSPSVSCLLCLYCHALFSCTIEPAKLQRESSSDAYKQFRALVKLSHEIGSTHWHQLKWMHTTSRTCSDLPSGNVSIPTSDSGVSLSTSINSSPMALPLSMKACLRAASGALGTGTTCRRAHVHQYTVHERDTVCVNAFMHM